MVEDREAARRKKLTLSALNLVFGAFYNKIEVFIDILHIFGFSINQYLSPRYLSISLRGLHKSVFGCLLFMNYKQEVIIQSLGPWMSERLFSLQQELMRAEISEPRPQQDKFINGPPWWRRWSMCMTHKHTAAKRTLALSTMPSVCVPMREVDATASFTSEVCDRL